MVIFNKTFKQLKILDLDDGLLQFAELDNTHVWSQKKPKNVTRMHRIVKSHPNAKIKQPVSKIDCPKIHRVPIPG